MNEYGDESEIDQSSSSKGIYKNDSNEKEVKMNRGYRLWKQSPRLEFCFMQIKEFKRIMTNQLLVC